jgi:hypothetical protein
MRLKDVMGVVRRLWWTYRLQRYVNDRKALQMIVDFDFVTQKKKFVVMRCRDGVRFYMRNVGDECLGSFSGIILHDESKLKGRISIVLPNFAKVFSDDEDALVQSISKTICHEYVHLALRDAIWCDDMDHAVMEHMDLMGL